MGSNQLYSFVAVVALVLPAVSLAEQFMVGDATGWTPNFDYQAWAAGKDFRVGDTLVFKYPFGKHNVMKVNESTFETCNHLSIDGFAYMSGNDEFNLTTPGKKWYICGIEQHCAEGGQKLAITVADATAKTPQSPSSANGIMPSGNLIVMAATMMMLMVV